MTFKLYSVALVTLLLLFSSACSCVASDTAVITSSGNDPNIGNIVKWTPIQASIWNPMQLYHEDWDVYGLRFNLLYGKNKNVYGFDLGLLNEFTNRAMGVQLGLMNFEATMNVDVPDFDSARNMDEYVKLNRPSFSGMQLGLLNQSGKITGMQLGLGNSAVTTTGIQLGIINNSTVKVNGVQISFLGFGVAPALGNMTTVMNGLQLGLVSIASESMRGTQINVFGAMTKKMTGAQIGLVNYAQESSGLQIGLINYSNKMKGVQIGLVNIISETEWLFTPIANAHF